MPTRKKPVPILYHPDKPDDLQPGPTPAIKFKLHRHGYVLLKPGKIRNYLERARKSAELDERTFIRWLQDQGVPATEYQLKKFLKGDDAFLTVNYIKAFAEVFRVTVSELFIQPTISRNKRLQDASFRLNGFHIFRALFQQGETHWMYEGLGTDSGEFVERVTEDLSALTAGPPLLLKISERPIKRYFFKKTIVNTDWVNRYLKNERD